MWGIVCTSWQSLNGSTRAGQHHKGIVRGSLVQAGWGADLGFPSWRTQGANEGSSWTTLQRANKRTLEAEAQGSQAP